MARSRAKGLDGLNRFYRELPGNVKQALREALHQGADELVAMQKSLVPVDEGALRDSIRKVVDNSGRDVKGDEGLRVYVIAGGSREGEHATWVEFGTKNTPAQPFFWPSYRFLRRRIRGRVGRAGGKAIRESLRSSS